MSVELLPDTIALTADPEAEQEHPEAFAAAFLGVLLMAGQIVDIHQHDCGSLDTLDEDDCDCDPLHYEPAIGCMN